MAGKIAVIGSNMVDLITYVDRMPKPGETVEAPSFEMGHGGKGANQAVAAARLGSRVVMVTKVGNDDFANATIRNFEANDIDTRFVTRVAGTSSGVAPIMVEPSGENSILIVKGANATLVPADVDAATGAIADADLVLMQLEVPLETVYYTIARTRQLGVPSLLNPAPAASLDIARLAGLTFLTPNQHELALISGLPVDNRSQAAQAARSLIERGIGTLIVTLGADGALLVEKDAAEHVPAVRVTAVDTTGAGDAFIGSFAHFYAGGLPLQTAIERAVLYAADSVTRRGTQKSYASAEAFAALLAREN